MNVIYYYHIPKCGGSFIRQYLTRLNDKNKNSIFIPYVNIFEHQYHTVPIIIKNILDLKYNNIFIYHHHSPYGMRDIHDCLEETKDKIINSGGTFFLFTSVREPTSYITSHINFINNAPETGPWPKEYRWSYDRAINEKWFSNYQSKYLLYNHYSLESYEKDISILDVRTELQLFNKIYKTDNLNAIKNDLRNKLSYVEECWDDKKINTTDHKLLLSEEQKETYLVNNQIDNWLYETVANL